METNRGYYAIGIVGGKSAANVGTLWRSAFVLGAAFIFTAGHRYPKQPTDTVKTWKHLPFYEYDSADDLFDHLPSDCVPVAVELDEKSRPLARYTHPERAIYLLGAEDKGLTKPVLARCRDIVQIPGDNSLNVAAAGTVVLYDRIAKTSRT